MVSEEYSVVSSLIALCGLALSVVAGDILRPFSLIILFFRCCYTAVCDPYVFMFVRVYKFLFVQIRQHNKQNKKEQKD
jgi:hypothetical protein